jgi:agmatinase
MTIRPQSGDIAVLGLPCDAHSSYRRGTAAAPPLIRAALHSDARNLCAENGLDLGADTRWRDLGDLDLADEAAAFTTIEARVAEVLAANTHPILVGGDHSVTHPVMKAFAPAYPGLTVLQLDAHPDLYDELDGNRHSHACPFARIIEEGLAGRLVQVGIRAATTHQREQATRFAVETVEMRHWRPDLLPACDGPVYLSLDLDVLDPAHAPGVAHPEPGGMTTRDVLGIIRNLGGRLVGADLVEYHPPSDAGGITAVVAAKLLKEIVARMLSDDGASA